MDERLEVMEDAISVDEMSMEPMAGETLVGSPQRRHGLMDILQPATPPHPKNARIIRRFDLEAAKYDPQPEGAPQTESERAARASKPRDFSRTREELRALRNRSLAAAAGFV